MTKLTFINSNEIKSYFPKHVEEIIDFLKKQGYKISCYKELSSSKYILKHKNLFAQFNSCEEICLFLREIYLDEREKEKNNYYKKMIKKELMINYVKNSSR